MNTGKTTGVDRTIVQQVQLQSDTYLAEQDFTGK